MTLARGETFGRYVVEEALGAGGGGEVYRARDTVLHRAVALKVLLPGSVGTDQGFVRARILREARAAAQLNHPNVVAIYDVGEEGDVPYMAMELVPGRSLRAYIGAADVSMERRLRWLTDIALALDAAHKSGLIHRDVKPENVIVRDDGVVKVVDFGIARQTVVDPHAPTAVEKTGTASAGTPLYMAPEQIKNEPLDARADQFGWGVTAYELLSGGELPWDASGGALQYVASIVGEEAKPLGDRAAVPEEVAAVVERTLRRSRGERFPTMSLVAESLDHSRAHSSPDAVRHVVSLRPPPELALQVTTKAPVSGEGDRSLPRSEETAPGVPLRRPRSKAWAVALVGLVAIAGGSLALRSPLRHATPGAEFPGAPSASAPAPAPTPITSLPLPNTRDRKALALYIEGIQAIRDGSAYVALAKLQEAVKLDAMLAQANLRLSTLFIDQDTVMEREAYERAYELRSLLSPRDQALLEALEPTLNRGGDTSGAEVVRRLIALGERYPGDAEIQYDLQVLAGDAGQFDVARAAGQRALQIDPQFYAVLASLGEDEAYVGDLDESLVTLGRCLDASGGATVCGFLKSRIYEQRGECHAMESEARKLLAASPGDGPGYVDLAEAMLARGAPTAAVRQLVAQAVSAMPEARRKAMEIRMRFLLDVAVGDFSSAEVEAQRFEQAISADSMARIHGIGVGQRGELYLETGRVKEAGALARATLEVRDGWTQDPRFEDEGISYDRLPWLFAIERAAGLLGPSDLEAKRSAWLRAWEARAPAPYHPYLWVQAYPDAMITEADTRDALAAAERLGGVPPFRPNTAALIGRVYLLAGRVEEAMPLLLSDARRCVGLRWPFEHVRAQYWLGRGYEAKGDSPLACAEYSDVLARWGNARPRSVTADDARKRAQSLGCKPPVRDR